MSSAPSRSSRIGGRHGGPATTTRTRTRGDSRVVAYAFGLALGLALVATTGCETFSARQAEAVYGPSEGLLETVAVLRRHVPDDTYRFPPATDFTGRNVYRASLLRLENLERVEADALRTGYADPVVLFAKARALERLRGFDLAAQHYREAARLSDTLRADALRSATWCDRLAGAVAIGLDLEDPLAASPTTLSSDAESIRRTLDERVAQLSLIEEDPDAGHYRYVAREEIERADRARARYFVAMRSILQDGTLLAVQELQRVSTRHGASHLRLRHLLDLADFYALLSREYVAAIPPASLAFDPARFSELFDAATQLYELVASHDGRAEKIEATRKLEAFLAFGLGIDADRIDR